MSYVAIYRKFRPQTFGQVKGQDHIVRTLQNQIKNNRLGHAYLFTGTRGTGKTSVARIFAKAINCTNPVDGEPCNECTNCKEITGGNFLDVVEIDAASNTGVDDIRRVIDEIQYTPVLGKYKVYIIDEVHMLSASAANAFLKTLEEPPEYVIFILATTEPHKLPITILSRCQRYDFKRISTEEIAENINEYLGQEGIEAEDKAVKYIARAGDGSMRDALSLLDKAVSFNLGKKLTHENVLQALGTVDTEIFSKVFRFITASDAYNAIDAIDHEVHNGKDLTQFVSDFIWYLRNLLLISVSQGKENEVLGLSEDNLKVLVADSKIVGSDVLLRYIRVLSELINRLRFSSSKQVLVEVAFIKLAKPQMETDVESLADRIRQLEEKTAGSIVQVINQAPAPARTESVNNPVAAESFVDAMYEESYFPEPQAEEYEPQMMEDVPPVREKPKMESIQKPVQRDEAPVRKQTMQGTPSAQVEKNWKSILQQYDMPIVRNQLMSAQVIAVDECTVQVAVDGLMAYKSLENKKGDLEALIKKVTGNDVRIIPVNGIKKINAEDNHEGGNNDLDDNERLEQLLKENIMMNIEEEE